MSDLLNEALAAYPGLAGADPQRIERGNINQTFLVSKGNQRWILQRLNPIFAPEVHFDIDAVTTQLEVRGLVTPRLLPTAQKTLWTVDSAEGVWRVLTHIDGVNHSSLASADMAISAGELLGRFHCAVADLQHTFLAQRPGVHDTERHLAHLERVLATSGEHPGRTKAAQLGAQILAAAQPLPQLRGLPPRVVHGDPKLNNIMFSPLGSAICMIDLDTVTQMSIPLELGDAMRSWCNSAGENAMAAHFDLDLLGAALRGYAKSAGALLTAAEITAIPVAIETVALELAARFCADIIEESYFAWDCHTYDAAWQHHAVRAEGQLRFAWAFGAVRELATEIISQVF